MADFLEGLGTVLKGAFNSAAGITENVPSDLDSQLGPLNITFGKLGSFADKIDKTAYRNYIEDGLINNTRPRNLEVLMQEPDITVLVKKRQFCSLSENYRTDLMDEEEKLFIRAARRLFYNKCRAIATYERLCKVERLALNNGVVSDQLFPMVYSLAQTGASIFPGLFENNSILSTLETIKKVKSYSDPNYTTTWISDRSIPYQGDTGEGTGVIELTTVASLNCTTSVDFGGGSASLSIEDPYKLTVITESDIEKAIAEATSPFATNNFFRISNELLQDQISQLKSRLREIRIKRGVGDFIYRVNPDLIFTKKVKVFFGEQAKPVNFEFDGGFVGIGSSVTFAESNFEGEQGLRGDESDLLEQIIINIYLALGIESQSNIELVSFNKKTNGVRSRMILEFNGRNIIQPMDEITVFISSKTMLDEKVSQGLNINFSDNNFLSKLNFAVAGLDQSIDQLNSMLTGSAGTFTEIEKNSIAGPEFPSWLWGLMRNQFLRQAAGTCVFSGVVTNPSHSLSSGKYTLDIRAADKTHYLGLGQININPAVDVFNGALYDPITPFKIDFDSSSGFTNGNTPFLLEENQRLLTTGAIKAQSGRFRGSPIEENDYRITEVEVLGDGFTRRKFVDPQGFVYRWKRGIGSLIQFGQPHGISFNNETSVNITRDPFAGQDVMNVLSLLVTGQPYNFNTFIKSAVDSGKLSRDTFSNQTGQSFYRGLISELRKVNATWGSFVPFKKLAINESSYNFLRSGQFDVTVTTNKIEELISQRASKYDLLISALPDIANNPTFYDTGAGGGPINVNVNILNNAEIQSLTKDIVELDLKIKNQSESFSGLVQNSNIKSTDGALRIFGNDVTFDSSVALNGDPKAEKAARLQLRQKMNILTQRRLWKVKGNEDPNLFIVDDSYDKNYDIQAFEQRLNGQLSLFNSNRITIGEKIQAVSQLLGLEVFADSQGHINARAPQYNKIPSSVFFKLLQKKQKKGIQIFPNFLESLFYNQITGLNENIEVIEDQIRLRAAALGAATDSAARQLLSGSLWSAGSLGDTGFWFLTEENTGSLLGTDPSAIMQMSYPDIMEDRAKETLQPFINILDTLTNKLKSPLSKTSVNFDINKRFQIINSPDTFKAINNVRDRFATIYDRLIAKNVSAPTFLELNPKYNSSLSGYSQSDLLKLTGEIAQLIRERQTAIQVLSNSVSNLSQGLQLNAIASPGGGLGSGLDSLFSELTGEGSSIPQILEHMIEDETFDDLGLSSGKRFIIKDSQIISLTIEENAPPYTSVEVKGNITGSLTDNPSGEGGDSVATAWSVDYDMWRQYGFKSAPVVEIPYFTDPSTQCAPYGVFLLNRARKEIFRGRVTVTGNEFIQPGEVYYIEDRDVLFYAKSITHSFTYGSSYNTSIELTYGHSPGEYIPTMLDIIGKGLYSKNHQANLVKHERSGNANGDTSITTLINDPGNQSLFGGGNPLETLLKGAAGDDNRKALGNLLAAASGLLSPVSLGEQPKIEIRIYKNSKQGLGIDSQIKELAEGIKEWAYNPGQFAVGGGLFSAAADEPPVIDPNLLGDIVEVDLGDPEELRSPSSRAWSNARTLERSTQLIPNIPNNPNQQQQISAEMLYITTRVIDIWMTFTTVDETTTGVKLSQNELSESDIQTRDKLLANFVGSLTAV